MFVKKKRGSSEITQKKVFQRGREDSKLQYALIAECWTNRKHPHRHTHPHTHTHTHYNNKEKKTNNRKQPHEFKPIALSDQYVKSAMPRNDATFK